MVYRLNIYFRQLDTTYLLTQSVHRYTPANVQIWLQVYLRYSWFTLGEYLYTQLAER